LGGELFEDFPDQDCEDPDAYYSGIRSTGSSAEAAGYGLRNLVVKTSYVDGYLQESLKDNALISEFEIALSKLDDLINEYQEYYDSLDEAE
ncbi:MAG: hypothetical protein ACI4CX_09465, partial [Candidatus Weimeria sp.]